MQITKITEIREAGECSCLEPSQTFTIVSTPRKNRHDVSTFLQENYQSKTSLYFFVRSDLRIISFHSTIVCFRDKGVFLSKLTFPISHFVDPICLRRLWVKLAVIDRL